jgi:hypothetical protein
MPLLCSIMADLRGWDVAGTYHAQAALCQAEAPGIILEQRLDPEVQRLQAEAGHLEERLLIHLAQGQVGGHVARMLQRGLARLAVVRGQPGLDGGGQAARRALERRDVLHPERLLPGGLALPGRGQAGEALRHVLQQHGRGLAVGDGPHGPEGALLALAGLGIEPDAGLGVIGGERREHAGFLCVVAWRCVRARS